MGTAHPDDEVDVRDEGHRSGAANSSPPEASEGFLRWLEGSDDESWRAESE